MQQELPIIQRTYDLIRWYVPLLNKFPRDQKFMLGDRIQTTLYGILESLIRARYRRDKLEVLEGLNASESRDGNRGSVRGRSPDPFPWTAATPPQIV